MSPRALTVICSMMGLAILVSDATAGSILLKDQLIGTWSYISSTAKAPDGEPLWGSNPKGLMILTSDGHVSWQVFRSDRPRFASNDRLNATATEYKAAVDGSLAYFGTYTVNEANKSVRFKVDASTFPNSEGEELTRTITAVSANELRYTNPATTLGAEVDAIWRRIR